MLKIYIQLINIAQNIDFPTLRPKGAQKPSNLHSSPKCWHDISNTKLYIQLTYIPQIVGSIYAILMYHCMGTEAVSVYLCIFVFVYLQYVFTLQTSVNIFFEVQCCLGIITGRLCSNIYGFTCLPEERTLLRSIVAVKCALKCPLSSFIGKCIYLQKAS